MTNTRRKLFAFAVLPLLLLALAACGPGEPTPGASGGGPTPSSTPTAEATPEPEVRAVQVSVNSALLGVYAVDDGEHLASLAYAETDHSAAAARIAAALGEDPVVTTVAGTGSGCDADQTIYDFGGFFLRSPGFVGSIGAIEVGITGETTAGGVPIFTLGGAHIGTPQAEFAGLVGAVFHIGTSGDSIWFGFDQANPGAPEFDAIGSIARFDGGVLAQVNTPYYFFGDC